MLNKRMLILGIVSGFFLAQVAHAQDYADGVQAQLTRQGYNIELVERTLLGRIRILARNTDGEREIIINPRTGEILRDLWSTSTSKNGSLLNIGGGRSKDGDGKDDDDDDDEEDEGGGNSGSGGGGDDDDDDDEDEDNSGSGSGGGDDD